MHTGSNPGLSMKLMIHLYDFDPIGAKQSWVDAGYCIDAPDLLAAGSTYWDEYGFDAQTWSHRLSSNA